MVLSSDSYAHSSSLPMLLRLLIVLVVLASVQAKTKEYVYSSDTGDVHDVLQDRENIVIKHTGKAHLWIQYLGNASLIRATNAEGAGTFVLSYSGQGDLLAENQGGNMIMTIGRGNGDISAMHRTAASTTIMQMEPKTNRKKNMYSDGTGRSELISNDGPVYAMNTGSGELKVIVRRCSDVKQLTNKGSGTTKAFDEKSGKQC